jgi:hypothetical protein
MSDEGEEVGFVRDKKDIARIPRLIYPGGLTLVRVLESNTNVHAQRTLYCYPRCSSNT